MTLVVERVVNALVGAAKAQHVYVLARCGHCADAPPPRPEHGDAEVVPMFVDCPTCGVPRHVIAYTIEQEG